MLENTLEIVKNPSPVPDEDPEIYDSGVRLFRHAQPGIVFDHVGK